MSTPEVLVGLVVAALAAALGLVASFGRRPVRRPPPGPPWNPADVRIREEEIERRRAEAAEIREEVEAEHAEARGGADAARAEIDAADTLDGLLRAEREERSS